MSKKEVDGLGLGCNLGCAIVIIALALSMVLPSLVRDVSRAYWEGKEEGLRR